MSAPSKFAPFHRSKLQYSFLFFLDVLDVQNENGRYHKGVEHERHRRLADSLQIHVSSSCVFYKTPTTPWSLRQEVQKVQTDKIRLPGWNRYQLGCIIEDGINETAWVHVAREDWPAQSWYRCSWRGTWVCTPPETWRRKYPTLYLMITAVEL